MIRVTTIKDDKNEKCKLLADTVMKLYGKISKLNPAKYGKSKYESKKKPKTVPTASPRPESFASTTKKTKTIPALLHRLQDQNLLHPILRKV